MKPVYTLGLGCERGCDPLELRQLAERVLAEAALSPGDLAGAFTIDQREHEPAIIAVADGLGISLSCYSAAQLEEQTPKLLNPSDAVFALVGCHGVAEAAALAGAGRLARLIIGKTKSAHGTAALATGSSL
ncbi:cobalamin biosynthesis protein [Phyllobacterium sp. 21LDTY02-6]|uniref:cobalamin biosynthesis protein n=1 Tax=Phyllobacterium sp. 21LDTY02-6 TaxID=2944903 RepID=UPI0020221E4D|nr:cobalamin biosynthesis protein [Phyllobacterium sp. 21LDTY02-6]MCO4316110.1 cobalamin biosynthesis protein [Phyllobacterium sp. 21LDTY02-6]